MKASKLIVAGLSLGMIVSLAGCATYQTRRVEYRETRSASERAAACVAAFEGENGKAPQVMTYDSGTGTETHLNTDGRKVTVTAQNAGDKTSAGMGVTLGERKPESCTSNDPVPRETDRRGDRNYRNSYTGYN